jgi:hypothetical protein
MLVSVLCCSNHVYSVSSHVLVVMCFQFHLRWNLSIILLPCPGITKLLLYRFTKNHLINWEIWTKPVFGTVHRFGFFYKPVVILFFFETIYMPSKTKFTVSPSLGAFGPRVVELSRLVSLFARLVEIERSGGIQYFLLIWKKGLKKISRTFWLVFPSICFVSRTTCCYPKDS